MWRKKKKINFLYLKRKDTLLLLGNFFPKGIIKLLINVGTTHVFLFLKGEKKEGDDRGSG